MVKGLARLHGGELDLQSELGRGTTAIIRLPVVCGPVEGRTGEPSAPADNVLRLAETGTG